MGSLGGERGRRGGTPVRIRDGPAAVRGDALRRTPLGRGLGRRRRGSPESEDLPVALHTDLLVEGGFVRQFLIATVVAALLVVTGAASGSTAALPHRSEERRVGKECR